MDDDIITPFNDGDIIDVLGNIKAHMVAAYNSDLDNYADCLNDALHTIEQLKKERDAAVGDLCLLKDTPFAGFCDICKNFGKENCRKCMESPEIDFPFYEWRGLQHD